MPNKLQESDHEIDLVSGEVAAIVPTFFEQRMTDLGVNAANNIIVSRKVNRWDENGIEWGDSETKNQLFEQKDGNIVINYYDLSGNPFTFHKEGAKWPKHFARTRLEFPKTDDNGKTRKYVSPSGSGNFPYFPPHIIAKWQSKTVIPVLIITEGEFKSYRGCQDGLDVVGVSGIHNFYSNDGDHKIHPEILRLIRDCKVKNILFLTDGDTLILKYKPDENLSERPNLFFAAIKNFREAISLEMREENTTLTDVYFGHIKSTSAFKGLDDLLIGLAARKEAIVATLRKLDFENDWFTILNISDGLQKIRKHFGLESADNFYTVYAEYIKFREFQYNKQTYVYNTDTDKIEKIQHRDVQNYMRIGCDYFKRIYVPNKYGEFDEEIKKWGKGEISQDYIKKYPNFIEEIPKFDAWCNVPSMDIDYKRVHNGCFNIFNPVKFTPKAGDITTSIFFIKHLFEGMGDLKIFEDGRYLESALWGDPFTVALDYLTLMFQNPKQILPVLCLVSPENGTGKSTFLKWLKDIYGSNATIIDNERFKMNFNSHYITKYIIGIDEGFLDVEKRAEKERLKKLATDDKQFLEFKGADVQEIDFYAKIIICSNDADSLMKIEEGEIRWFVVRVKSFASKGYVEDPDFKEKLRAEIPAFLHFLKNRQVIHPKEGRAWFHPQHIVTDQLKAIIENTRNYSEKVVDDYIEELFLTYKLAEIKLPLNWLVERINKQSKYKLDPLTVKKYLKDKKGMKLSDPSWINIPEGFETDHMRKGETAFVGMTARHYTFSFKQWVKDTTVPVPESKELDELPF